jgi:NADP-dependent aldehyde dehydrogenase
MLHAGIARAYTENKQQALNQNGVKKISDSEIVANENEGLPTIATVSSQNFLQNPILHKEVFGPFSLIIQCKNEVDMLAVSNAMEGQLTATLMATTGDANKNPSLVESVKNICGRLIMNGVPTGVEVCRSMHHGGPYPATTDSRFTSVGADGIRRFARPLAFQNWPNELLPHELKDENPLKIWRMINSEMVAPKI